MEILVTRQAARDLRAIAEPDAGRVAEELRQLGAGAPNLDLTALTGRRPWQRLRVGDWRVLLRPLTSDEGGRGGYLVARVVNRRDLERAVRAL